MQLDPQLKLNRCPHCKVDTPTLMAVHTMETRDSAGQNPRRWSVYNCSRCGGLVTASAHSHNQTIIEFFPSNSSVDEDVPQKPREYLTQALDSIHAPAGAVILAASAVDAMLKIKGYDTGILYTRINQATKDHLITKDMSRWAHQVRLGANDQRHADEDANLPTQDEARQSIRFAQALAEFIFVLPSKVSAGLQDTSPESENSKNGT